MKGDDGTSEGSTLWVQLQIHSALPRSALAGEEKYFLKHYPTAPRALTPADGQQQNLEGRAAAGPLAAPPTSTGSLQQARGDHSQWKNGGTKAANPGYKAQGSSAGWRTDREELSKTSSVSSANALKLGRGGG